MIAEILLWWLAAEMLGLAAFPVIERLACGSLRDGGYSVSKIFGMIFVTYVVWILASLKILKYDASLIALAVIVLLTASAFLFDKARHVPTLRRMMKIDVIFTLAFLFFALVVRAHNPDIAGAEKPMDFAILNSIGRSDYFPPQDPWFSGTGINYYYFGYLSFSVLSKLLGTPPSVAYNLAIVLIFALSVQAAFGIGYHLGGGRWRAGLLAAVLVAVAGNLLPLVQATAGNSVFDYWSASRIIPNTINEFPFFSFLFGDLHAHIMAIPVQLALVSMAISVLGTGTISLSGILPLSLLLGSLYPMSGWYYPTYFLFIASVLVLAKRKWMIPLLLLASLALYYPFYANFSPPVTSIGIVTETTDIQHFLTFFGIFVFLIWAFLFARQPVFMAGALILSGLAAFFLRIPVLAAVLPMGVGSLRELIFVKKLKEERLPFLLVIFGALLAIALELFFIDDAFGPPFERMNTVFKYYIQIWIFLAVASAYFASRLLSRPGWPKAVIVLALVASAIYPMAATYTITGGFQKIKGLDGTGYMKEQMAPEYGAIEWLNKNVFGTKVILEAPGESYTRTSVISSNTGLPTVIGWVGHEMQWGRSRGDSISKRVDDVNAIYSGKGVPELLNKYEISYVYVGPAEVKKYGSTIKNFGEDGGRFRQVYSNYNSIIYEVTG